MGSVSVYDNAKRVLERISECSVRSGRAAGEVKLVAASKTASAEKVREAVRAGVTAFGENRVQELTEKLAEGAYEGAELHFIGHLQKNKIKSVVGQVSVIESVDSPELLSHIGDHAAALGIVQDVFIEINIGNEASKSGIAREELGDMLGLAGETPGVRITGLMAIPPRSQDIGETRAYFDEMKNLFVDTRGKKYDNVNMTFLSMGMSADFEEAILRGANIVRVGSAIFGERIYPQAR